VIKKIDRVLELLEDVLLPLSIGGHVGDRP
jgi:hypothetical protein